jgi:hypothetical protein
MVVAIKASPLARDFTPLAEQFFRAVAHRTLTIMLADPAFIADSTPHLWSAPLRRLGPLERLDAPNQRTEVKIDAQAGQLTRMETRVEAVLARLGPTPPHPPFPIAQSSSWHAASRPDRERGRGARRPRWRPAERPGATWTNSWTASCAALLN